MRAERDWRSNARAGGRATLDERIEQANREWASRELEESMDDWWREQQRFYCWHEATGATYKTTLSLGRQNSHVLITGLTS